MDLFVICSIRNQIKNRQRMPSTGCAKIRIVKKIKLANRKEIFKRLSLIIIFSTLIMAIGVNRGETYSALKEDPECLDSTNTRSDCDEYNPSLIEVQIDNILFDENGELNFIMIFLLWFTLTSVGFVITIREFTSEHVLSGKCMTKKKSGEGYCSREQLPGKLYCKQHLEENRFKIKKRG